MKLKTFEPCHWQRGINRLGWPEDTTVSPLCIEDHGMMFFRRAAVYRRVDAQIIKDATHPGNYRFQCWNVEESHFWQKIPTLEDYPGRIGVAVSHGLEKSDLDRHFGLAPRYYYFGDYIGMPPREAFSDPVDYYAVLLHETIHATGRADRLNRVAGRKAHSCGVAIEEITAFAGACYLLMLHRVTDLTPDNVMNTIRELAAESQLGRADIKKALTDARSAVNYLGRRRVNGATPRGFWLK